VTARQPRRLAAVTSLPTNAGMAMTAPADIWAHPAARSGTRMNWWPLRSHRGGQGFKSPQLHPDPQVRGMFGLNSRGLEDHLSPSCHRDRAGAGDTGRVQTDFPAHHDT